MYTEKSLRSSVIEYMLYTQKVQRQKGMCPFMYEAR